MNYGLDLVPSTATGCGSDVEPEVDHVSVLDHVVLALHAKLAHVAALGLAAQGDQIFPPDDFGADEAPPPPWGLAT
jgi:hypothetical protein